MTQNNQQVKITLPNDLTYLPLILDGIKKMAEIMGFKKNDILKIEIGAEEAISNVIKHAFEPDEKSTFDVILNNLSLGLKIIIKEKGIPFDPSLIHEFKPDELKEDLSGKGLGVFLIKQFIDEVSFHNLGKEGRETHLFKHLKNKTINQLVNKAELDVLENEKQENVLPKGSVSYDVRRMNPEEAVDVSKGAYSSYGYTYVLEHIYYPDRVRQMNKDNTLISFVCVTGEKEIIGHCALEIEETDPLVPQLGVAFTKPKYRGQGCLNRLAASCMDYALNLNLFGIYARGVTTHPYSQKSLLRFEIFDCAIYISSGAIREYKDIEGTAQRESVVIHFKYLNPTPAFKIYPPEHHKDIIEKIYNNIKYKPIFELPPADLKFNQNDSVIDIQTDQLNMVAKIYIEQFGENILSEISKNLKELCFARMETIYLYLKLNNNLTSLLTSEFEKMGFFFSGVMPRSGQNDVLILQYLNNYTIDYDKIKIASEFGNDLLNYIRERDVNQNV